MKKEQEGGSDVERCVVYHQRLAWMVCVSNEASPHALIVHILFNSDHSHVLPYTILHAARDESQARERWAGTWPSSLVIHQSACLMFCSEYVQRR